MPLDDPPLASIPFSEHAGVLRRLRRQRGEIPLRLLARDSLAVVADHHTPLGRVAPLAVPARHRLGKQLLDGKRVDIDLVDRPLHVIKIDEVGRVGEMPHHRRHAAHELVLHVARTHVALRVDEVGADDELLRLLVDHPVGMRAADALRPHVEAHVWGNGVELVATARGGVRWVGEKPEPARPGHDGTDATLAVAGE